MLPIEDDDKKTHHVVGNVVLDQRHGGVVALENEGELPVWVANKTIRDVVSGRAVGPFVCDRSHNRRYTSIDAQRRWDREESMPCVEDQQRMIALPDGEAWLRIARGAWVGAGEAHVRAVDSAAADYGLEAHYGGEGHAAAPALSGKGGGEPEVTHQVYEVCHWLQSMWVSPHRLDEPPCDSEAYSLVAATHDNFVFAEWFKE